MHILLQAVTVKVNVDLDSAVITPLRRSEMALGIAIPDWNFQFRDSGLSNSQSRDPVGIGVVVRTTENATWVTVFGSLFLNYKYV